MGFWIDEGADYPLQFNFKMKKYLPRVADEVLKLRLEASGAILISGPKWCGKSTTAGRLAASSVFMQDPAKKVQNEALAKMQPSLLLSGPVPRLIDEWQMVPSLWDAVRFEVDQRGEMGQFLLTGSAVPPAADQVDHSGTGRIARFVMRPMSLFESGDSSGTVSIAALFEGAATIAGKSSQSLIDYARLLCRGGWPAAVGLPERAALLVAHDYYDGLVHSDMSRVDGVKRSPERIRLLMRSYARLTATQATFTTIQADVASNDAGQLKRDTLLSYVEALRRLYVIDDLDAWSPFLLAKNTLRAAPTRHFVDPSIACAALEIGPGDLVSNLPSFGFLFESMAVRDLRAYASALFGNVLHFRDRYGLEADAVIYLRDGRYGLFEIKLYDDDNIELGAANLKKIAAKIDTSKMKAPSFLVVITGSEYAYRRPDGVFVLPLGCLKP